MKIAKASEADLKAAMDICSTLDAINSQWGPSMPGELVGLDDDEWPPFDIHNSEHCKLVVEHLMRLSDCSRLNRVVMGMAVLLDPTNKVVDEEADTIEFHPQREKDEKDAARWRYVSQFLRLDDVGDETFVLGLVVDDERMADAVQSHASRLDKERRDAEWKVPNPETDGPLDLPLVALADVIDAAILSASAAETTGGNHG